jgi:hypothetical protein
LASFIEEFMKAYGPEVSKQLSSNLDVKQDVASQIIPLVTPMILGGLKRQMKQYGGKERANHILSKYGSAGILDNIGEDVSSRARYQRPDPRLGGLLGESGVQAADTMSKRFKLNPNTTMKIISILAPIILGALTRKRDRGRAGSSGIAALIDQNGDDSILDDVVGLLMGGMAGSSSKKGGDPVSDLISEFTTPRCPKCSSSIASHFKFCPECGIKFRK